MQGSSKKTRCIIGTNPHLLLLAFALVLIIGWIDYITAWELSLFVLYSIPIAIAAWWCGNFAGLFIASLCCIIWLCANLGFSPYKTEWGIALATGSRWVYFFMVSFAIGLARKKQESDKKLIQLLEHQNQLERDLAVISEYEKKRLGRELHDGLCQQLAAIGCATQILSDEFGQAESVLKRDLELINKSIHLAMLEARALASDINPVYLEESDLAGAIRQFVRISSALSQVTISVLGIEDIGVLDKEKSLQLYRIVQESVSNALRHAHCVTIQISMKVQDGMLVLLIQDDGIGMPQDSILNPSGMGIRSMQYRANSVGGHLDIISKQSGGTGVTCLLPVS